MNMKITATLFCTLIAGWMSSASAQEVYRCGTSYSQSPCPGGGGKVVQVEDARSASQRSQTSEASQRDAKAADVLEKARLKDEAKPAALAVLPAKGVEPVAQSSPRGSAKGKAKKPAHFSAVAPTKPGDNEPKKKRKKEAA